MKTIYEKQFNVVCDENSPMRAIITVPANFTEKQRRSTLEAAHIANIKVELLVSEPTGKILI
jgi:molecular chaperone DnaK (HSP70)